MPNQESCRAITLPKILYGTAWKEDRTQTLTEKALRAGFRGIDTANQRKHYHEAAVGQAIAAVIADGIVTRDELFLQTKFTFRGGQDHRLPYDPAAPVEQQVAQSFASSLEHLQTDHVDAYLLHGPSQAHSLGTADWQAWRAFEALYDTGKVRFLGVSNVSLEQLKSLLHGARVRPRFVQNRCYARTAWDREVREFCVAEGLVYQGFSLLTANPHVVRDAEVRGIATKYGLTPEQLILCFAAELGMIPLTGTTDITHMHQDLHIFDCSLLPEERRIIELKGSKLERKL
jgi:diketogulonate reductase-like aldo/keto reductase